MQVSFLHFDTKQWLMSHAVKYQRPIAGQQEVACKAGKDANAQWVAGVGIYFSKTEDGSHDEL